MKQVYWKRTSMIGCLMMVVFLSGCGQKLEAELKDYATLNPQKDFTLTDHNNKPFHLKDHRGKAVLLFFGYLSCPDVCPLTMARLSKVYKFLGEDSPKVMTVFVTVDPQRDTIVRLKEYFEYFDINALGLTGSKEQVDAVVNAYKAVYEKVETESAAGYLMNHTDYVYLIDPKGTVQYLFHEDEDKPEKMAQIIKASLK